MDTPCKTTRITFTSSADPPYSPDGMSWQSCFAMARNEPVYTGDGGAEERIESRPDQEPYMGVFKDWVSPSVRAVVCR